MKILLLDGGSCLYRVTFLYVTLFGMEGVILNTAWGVEILPHPNSADYILFR